MPTDRSRRRREDGIKTLAERWGLPDAAVGGLVALLELISRDPEAPTTVRDPRHVLDDHLADSLVALDLAPVRAASALADLGTGAGFPGLPLALALPGARFFLLESNRRKCAFLARAVDASGAGNVTIVNARAEEWQPGLGVNDIVTARALAPLPVVAEYAAPLLRVGGALVAWRGRRESEAELAVAAAAAELGLEVQAPRQVFPFPRAEHRYLHVIAKTRVTPGRFPRRPGIALKRPLGGRLERSSGPAPRAAPSDRRQR